MLEKSRPYQLGWSVALGFLLVAAVCQPFTQVHAQGLPFANVPEAKLAQWYNARTILSAVLGLVLGLLLTFVLFPRLKLTGGQQNLNGPARRLFFGYLFGLSLVLLIAACLELALANPLRLVSQLSIGGAAQVLFSDTRTWLLVAVFAAVMTVIVALVTRFGGCRFFRTSASFVAHRR